MMLREEEVERRRPKQLGRERRSEAQKLKRG